MSRPGLDCHPQRTWPNESPETGCATGCPLQQGLGRVAWLDHHQRGVDLSGYTGEHGRKSVRLRRVDSVFRGGMWWVGKDSLKAYLELVEPLGQKRLHAGGIDAAPQAVGPER